MSAHNPATLDYARRRTQYVIEHLTTNETARSWAAKLQHLIEVGSTGGSLRQWMQGHDGALVDTLQVTLKLSGADAVAIRRAWAPGSRVAHADHASYLKLDDSRRDYAGVVTYVSEPTVGWIGFTTEGTEDGHEITLICYYAA